MLNQSSAPQTAHWGPPYLLYLGKASDELAIKTARGLAYWRPEWCIGQLQRPGCKTTLGLRELDFAEAKAAGANTMVVGMANAGGIMDPQTVVDVIAALDAGLHVAAGLHNKLRENPDIVAAAQRNGRELFDARDPAPGIPVGTGRRRAGKRLLTVGTDCSTGKMYTTLALEREMHKRGLKADFRGTGQTGILVANCGVPIDSVVADFISGAAEWISPARFDGGWDLIEGQGSLFHPSYAGVSLGLLHGAQPDALVLTHEPGRLHMRGLPDQRMPSLRECLDANLRAARLTNPDVRAVGVTMNTSGMASDQAQALCAKVSAELDLPCTDPVTMGVAPIVDHLLTCFAN
jgi:uncharacterized NAD-dependent epimerase/dehydratase family protein